MADDVEQLLVRPDVRLERRDVEIADENRLAVPFTGLEPARD